MKTTTSRADISLGRERVFVVVFLLLTCLVLARSVHGAWVIQIPGAYVVPGTPIYYIFQPVPPPLHAPEAYRVAMPALGHLLLKTFPHSTPSTVAAVLDFFFGFGALYLLYRLTTDDLLPGVGTKALRLTAVGFFLALIQFPLAWVTAWIRPETLPSGFFVAAALFCLARVQRSPVWTVLLLAVSTAQGFVRSDVAAIFGVAVVGVSLAGRATGIIGSRSANVFRGAAVAAIAVGVQAYLQFIRFPHLTYWPSTPVINFFFNLTKHAMGTFLIAELPFLALLAYFMLRKARLGWIEAIAATSAGLYMPLWAVVGSVSEVRIYVPYMLVLCMVGARVLANDILSDDDAAIPSV